MVDNNNNNNDDDSSVESGNRYYNPIDLNADVLANLKGDDPDYDSIYVTLSPSYGFDPLSIDWANEGSAIAENKFLRWIEIRNLDQANLDEARARNAKSFYRAVAANRSIRYLLIEGSAGLNLGGDIISTLRPFVENNTKLYSFNLSHITLDSRTAQLIASSLSCCTSSLSCFWLTDCHGLTKRMLQKIINAMRNRPNIETLGLTDIDIDDDIATLLGDTLATLSSLRSLTLAGDDEMRIGSISSAGMKAISDGLAMNSTLEKLSLRRMNNGIEGGLDLAEAISNNSTLKELDLSSAVSPFSAEYILTRQGWMVFFEYLENCALRQLSLGGNTIGDEDITPMVESLSTMRSLTTLNLWGSMYITAAGWATFFRLLKHNTSLQSCEMYAHSIAEEQDQRDVMYTALANTLCDKTSIENVIDSNHTLSSVEGIDFISPPGIDASFGIQMPPACKSLLQMNKSPDKVEVARQKIIKYYFFEGNNLGELVHIETGLLPRVLECIGKTELKLLYEAVRAMPSLITLSLVDATGKASGGKRKRRS